MSWWLWIVFGAALLVAEVFLDAAFWLLFIGLSALLLGLGGFFGLTGGPVAQWLAFAVLSLALLYFFRGRLRAAAMRRKDGAVEVVVNEEAIAVSAMAVGACGKATLRGAEWSARNVGSAEIPQGARARVARVNQLVLELTQD